MKKPHILITNDDGIHAPGILSLIEVALEFGQITVVAPNSPQSGMGHAITIGKPMRVHPHHLIDGVTGYAVDGTPADCVKFGTGILMKRDPDLVLSGINHGANSSVSTIYSGTLSAAREGAIQGYRALGFSLCNFSHQADMHTAQAVARVLIEQALQQPLDSHYCLNINIPDLPLAELQGIKITRQAAGRWIEEFDQRTDPFGRPYYWLSGHFELLEEGEDTDEYALSHGYVSVTPLSHDLTNHDQIKPLGAWTLHL